MNPESWQILGLDPSATVNQVRQRFRQLALKYHPDKGGSQYIFDQIKNAYKDILTFHQGLNQKSHYDLRGQSRQMMQEQSKQSYRGHLNPNNLDMDKFNNFFVQHRLNDPLEHGYGHLMEESSHHREEDAQVAKANIRKFADQQLILYQDPQEVFGCSSNVGNLGDDNSNFTTAWNAKTKFTDYVEAHSKPVDRDIIPARESFKSIDALEANRKKSLKATKEEQRYHRKMEKKREKDERKRMSRVHNRDSAITSHYQKIQNLLGFR
jgi:curved DNA-binding protein CbpA